MATPVGATGSKVRSARDSPTKPESSSWTGLSLKFAECFTDLPLFERASPRDAGKYVTLTRAKLRMRRIDSDGTRELVTAIRLAFCEEHVKRGQRSKLYVLELHELRLSKRQSFQKRVRLVHRRHIQQEDRTLLILACPPLLNGC